MSASLYLLSPDSTLADRLWEYFSTCRLAKSYEDLFEILNPSTAIAVVIDARGVIDGGHAVDQAIARLCGALECEKIIVLCSASPPEPLERRAAMSEVQLYTDLDEMVGALAVRNDSLQEDEERDPPLSQAVLQGVTRRFETNSVVLKRMIEDLAVAAEHDVTILLIGETGSGKTFLSNLIHEASPRRKEPFLPVACGALPRDLIESELFGHVKGAFTSAHADKEGKFLAAGRGTILLDEIDVLGPEQQVKLLRVIETGEFEPVGSNRTYKSQARLVVASNLDLQPLVEAGRFRPDLYYRLNMLKFEIPPLRTRKVDIIPLARAFVKKFHDKHGIRIDRIEDSFVEALLAYPWPGNVRELENVVQRSVIYCRDGILTRMHLPPHIVAGEVGPTNDPTVQLGTMRSGGGKSLESKVALTEREIIEQTLLKNNFNRTNTAKELGISRVTLYNKMKKYDMMK